MPYLHPSVLSFHCLPPFSILIPFLHTFCVSPYLIYYSLPLLSFTFFGPHTKKSYVLHIHNIWKFVNKVFSTFLCQKCKYKFLFLGSSSCNRSIQWNNLLCVQGSCDSQRTLDQICTSAVGARTLSINSEPAVWVDARWVHSRILRWSFNIQGVWIFLRTIKSSWCTHDKKKLLVHVLCRTVLLLRQ